MGDGGWRGGGALEVALPSGNAFQHQRSAVMALDAVGDPWPVAMSTRVFYPFLLSGLGG
jgi:hypothetical protein